MKISKSAKWIYDWALRPGNVEATETWNLSISILPLEMFHKPGGDWISGWQDLDVWKTNLNSKLNPVYEGILRRRPVI